MGGAPAFECPRGPDAQVAGDDVPATSAPVFTQQVAKCGYPQRPVETWHRGARRYHGRVMGVRGGERGFDDISRLAALADYRVLDTGAEACFDNLTELTAKIFGTPISLVSLVDEHRQWFKSHRGLDVSETPREYAFCDHAIRADDTLMVPDTWVDERFSHNPLVLGDPHIRFYCGVPLRTPEGHGLGTLCIIDRQPRQLDAQQLSLLRGLARQVELELEIRRRLSMLEEQLGSAMSAAKSRELLATMVVHDMRGPLTAVTMLASMITPADPESRSNLDALAAEAERLRFMLVNILDVCLHDSCGLRPRCRIFDVVALAKDVVERRSRCASALEVQLDVETTMAHFVDADPDLVTRLLENLVGNAVDHGTASPRVTVSFRDRGKGRILCEVKDRGVTIAETQRATVFDPLTRGVTAHRGYGLGLAFCRIAVEAHGGHIGVRPNPDGEGNTFCFDLPAADTSTAR